MGGGEALSDGQFNYKIAVATRYWHAANLCLESQTSFGQYYEPVGLMHGMAAEICLKALLQLAGLPEKTLRSTQLRHDLHKLFSLAIENSFVFSKFSTEAILHMSPSHSYHFFRYGSGDINTSEEAFKIQLCDPLASHVATAELIDRATANDDLANKLKKFQGTATWSSRQQSSPPATIQTVHEIWQAIQDRKNDLKLNA